MKKVLLLFVVFVIGSMMADMCMARWFIFPRRRVSVSRVVTVRTGPMYSGTDQERAQAEASHMANNKIRGHVGGLIGHFEGVGWAASSSNCATCTPRRGMRLTADAVAQDSNGRWYRVRAWR